jgi:hypothetical protein
MEINKHGNKYNIDFNPTADSNEELDILLLNTLLNKELCLHGLPLSGNMMEWQAVLRKHVMIEARLDKIKEAIQCTQEGKEAALILIKQTVPCIMHTENRVGEKVITVVFVIGATKFHWPKQWRFLLKENGKEVSISCFLNIFPKHVLTFFIPLIL